MRQISYNIQTSDGECVELKYIYRRPFRTSELYINGKKQKLKPLNAIGLNTQFDCRFTIDGKEYILARRGGFADFFCDGKGLLFGMNYVRPIPVPEWLYIFSLLCLLMPFVMGGWFFAALGIVSAALIFLVSRTRNIAFVKKVVSCLLVFGISWAIAVGTIINNTPWSTKLECDGISMTLTDKFIQYLPYGESTYTIASEDCVLFIYQNKNESGITADDLKESTVRFVYKLYDIVPTITDVTQHRFNYEFVSIKTVGKFQNKQHTCIYATIIVGKTYTWECQFQYNIDKEKEILPQIKKWAESIKVYDSYE